MSPSSRVHSVFDRLEHESNAFFDFLLRGLRRNHQWRSGLIDDAEQSGREAVQLSHRVVSRPTDIRGNGKETLEFLARSGGRALDMARWAVSAAIEPGDSVVIGSDNLHRINGTRVRVKDIVAQYQHEAGGRPRTGIFDFTVVSLLGTDFSLSESQVRDALDYWWTHPEELEREMEAERESFRRQSRPKSSRVS